MTQLTLAELQAQHAQPGTLRWIGLRPARDAAMLRPTIAQLEPGCGITGDRYRGQRGVREVTLIQWEHLAVIAAILGVSVVQPEQLRRNLAVSGINLYALQRAMFRIGETLLEGTGLCHPCSRMQQTLGGGGYSAVRGHGGITARIVRGGPIQLGDAVQFGTT